MATEKNPFEQMRPAAENIIQLNNPSPEQPQTDEPTFESIIILLESIILF